MKEGLDPAGGVCPPKPDLLTLQVERYLRRMPGRETFVWPSDPAAVPGSRMIVKRHGARAGRAWLGRRTPGEREYEALAELAAIGLPVPRPLFWSERAGRSAVAMELVEHRETLHGALDRARGAEARALIEELARVVARFHDEGWYHRDLYLQHVVVRTGPAGVGSGPIGPGAANRLCLIDLGRARHAAAPRRRWFVKDLAALLHSAPAGLGRAAQLRFLVRYLRLRGVRGRSEVLGWARAIERKRARMAAHEPRHGEHIPEHEAAERELRG